MMKFFTKRVFKVGGTLVATTTILFVVIFHRHMRSYIDNSERRITNDQLPDSITRSNLDIGNRLHQQVDIQEGEITIDDLNERWSWSSIDAEAASKQDIKSLYYTEEELTPWIEKPMYSFGYPGKFGKPYTPESVTTEEQERLDEGWGKYHFNELVCSKIPLHRYLGDDREDACKARKWKKPMAKTSVVIIFYNEAWCTLMRTVFSILETTPKILLKEIILVDDVSTYDNLKEELDEFVKRLKIVRIVRMKERLGIVPARMAGARATTGEVIVFLDAHCECTKGWLEPLLERIADEPNAVMCPVLEDMPFDTFSFTMRRTEDVPIGVTNWDLGFGWGGQRDRPANEPKDAVIKCPVMVGAMFAVRRSYFFDLGAFDEEMRFWGGEQLEISFRIWLCGGTLEIHPCSHVGHMHRKGFQYNDLGDAIAKNNRRVADVWMDEYKEQFFKRSPRARLIDPGDLSSRIELRERLQCKNFSWFLENLHPDLYAVPYADVVYWGQWATSIGQGAVCFDSGSDIHKPLILYPCHGQGSNQLFMLTKQGEMRLNGEHEYCMIPEEPNVVFEPCVYPNAEVPILQKWQFIEIGQGFGGFGKSAPASPRGYLKHSSGRCLENIKNTNLELRPCENASDQIWFFRDMPTEEGYQP